MTRAKKGERRPGWKRYCPAMALCFALGLFFIGVVHGLNVPYSSRADIAAIEAAGPAAEGAGQSGAEGRIMPASQRQLARLGGFMAYRGYALMAMTIAVAVIALSLLSIFLFVRDRSALAVVLCVFALQLGIALTGTIVGGTAMGKIAARMNCGAEAASDPWDFCSLRLGEAAIQLGFNRWVEVLCTVGAVAVVFAIFIVASSRRPRRLPAMLSSPERCVTLLMVAASTLLTARLLLNKSFLQWAFADFLAVDKPPAALNAYIAGTSTFNGAIETCLLGLSWFIALLLLERGPKPAPSAGGAAGSGSASFSVYNVSAIFAPVLSAIASNFLGG